MLAPTKPLRVVLFLGLAVGVVLLGRPVFHIAGAAFLDRDTPAVLPPGTADDAGRHNLQRIDRIWTPPAAESEAALRTLLTEARARDLHVSIAGARHSMGGHTLYPGGIVINMLSMNQARLLDDGQTLRVQAGARWRDIIPLLHRAGRAVSIMQSNNDFTVGGSLSVNCHGWQHGRPPIASTVRSLRLMLASGEVVRCSRTENPELFSLVLGGYGLFGVILDADLETVPNQRYQVETQILDAAELPGRFSTLAADTDVGMVFGRLSVAPTSFLERGIVTAFRVVEGAPPERTWTPPKFSRLKRWIFRGSIGSDYGKELRWFLETHFGAEQGKHSEVTRSTLQDEPARIYGDRTFSGRDVLHEYFIPQDRLIEVVSKMRLLVPQHELDLLNVTVREIREDQTSFLRYADQDMYALVLLFHQPPGTQAEARMKQGTQALIDAALAAGGRYYLPYREHATLEQFRQAYPQSAAFHAQKLLYDPTELFQSQFYVRYLAP